MGIEQPAMPANGREADLADLLRRMWPRLQRILGAFHVPPEDADDLVQDIAMQFIRKRNQIRTPEQWFSGALRNQCRMYWRSRSRRITVAVDQAVLDARAGGAESDAERAALRRGLARWIATLPRKCRELLRLRYGLGLEDEEVAEKTGYRPSSVDKVTRRCVEALSKKLAAADLGRLRVGA
jgi:RNA polymerase sigma factor (sigma-70 family)